ncbi:Histidine phosphatase superfamily, clade-2 [Metarhizium album ARSEF 1941]|uniref:Histidine phosphatase superfamily, clade-2 n=1 Tax=Metarhizium album (strain ARSEF 1941) TaxID=1081103 RepID=A0A0B2WQI4_METAS|nr:Histidine phosphatase superfamily, clade-2 [Metarhizium album ARSEF 1941]KHN98321.1 Histidine phosphatase superfamily, clade-2 [Metarhizium album ARSEF 1941]
MTSTSILVAVGGLLARVAAQTANPTVRAAVVFINHGETTPNLVSDRAILTPNGAQQMQRLGAAFRSRYLGGTAGNATSSNSAEQAPILSLSTDSIDNAQMTIMAATQEWSTNSAAAFMQGLYPPKPGTSYVGRNLALNSNTTDYPLDGYQYAQIMTYSNSDVNSVAIQGYEACTAWQDQMSQNLSRSTEIAQRVSDKAYFYSKLFASGPMQGSLPASQATYLNAEEIYHFVDFNYAYNETVHNSLQDPNGTLSVLQNNAFSLEKTKTSYSDKNTNTSDAANVLYSIAGRTLADKVTDQFSTFLATSGTRGKLTLMFGSFQTLMAFFSLAGLIDDQSAAADAFSQLPRPGSAIAFELVGDTNSSDDFDGLQVRFSYKPSADAEDKFSTHPLFGSKHGGAGAYMPYTSFFSNMSEISKTPRQWCKICSPGSTATFCLNSTLSDGQESGSSSSAISPAVAGILGAVLTAVLIACVAAGFAALGGWRFSRRKGGPGGPGPAGSAVGGFRGKDKMASDADMTVSNAGRNQERVGSWELGDGRTGGAVVTGKFAQRTRAMDEDGISITGAPVKARETV